MVSVKKLSGLALLGAGLYFGRLLLPEPAQRYVIPVFLIGAAVYLSAFKSVLTLGRASVFARPALGIVLVLAGLWSFPLNQPVQRTEWQPYTLEMLETASKDGRPVMIDFTASWCQVCKELEDHVFTDPKVIRASCSFVRLHADMTRQSALANSLAKQFGVKGLPTIVFIDSRGKEIRNLRVIGAVSPTDFLSRMVAVK
jgi:thioredoxin:protein disulfide reductase